MNKASKKLQEEVRKNNKRVRDRNYRFQKLSPENKRVSIAKDVIKQLVANKITAQTGSYFELRSDENIVNEDLSFAISKAKSCNVCALGALFSACVLKSNHFKLNSADIFADNKMVDIWRTPVTEYLKPYFSKHQLAMIEIAFEKYAGGINIKIVKNVKTIKKCTDFGNQFLDDEDRMTAIMQNIIDNNGKFVP